MCHVLPLAFFLSQVKNATFTFSKDFVSQTLCLVDEETEQKRAKAQSQQEWLTSKGFRYPAAKTRQDLITHPKVRLCAVPHQGLYLSVSSPYLRPSLSLSLSLTLATPWCVREARSVASQCAVYLLTSIPSRVP